MAIRLLPTSRVEQNRLMWCHWWFYQWRWWRPLHEPSHEKTYLRRCATWHDTNQPAQVQISHDMTKPTKMSVRPARMSVRPAKTQINLGIRQVWLESSLCAQWVAQDPRFLHADSEDSDQTWRMPRLIWVFAGCTLILLVLSCRGSDASRSLRISDIATIGLYYLRICCSHMT